MSKQRKIKIPKTVSTDMLDPLVAAQGIGKYSDVELGQMIAAYDFANQFMRKFGDCKCTVRYLSQELESFKQFKENRERKEFKLGH